VFLDDLPSKNQAYFPINLRQPAMNRYDVLKKDNSDFAGNKNRNAVVTLPRAALLHDLPEYKNAGLAFSDMLGVNIKLICVRCS
jgi:hypothetical protein